MGSKYNKVEAKKRFESKNFSNKKLSIIAISVDVRNSTQLRQQVGVKKALKWLNLFLKSASN